MEKESKAELS